MDFTKQTYSYARAEQQYDQGLRIYMLSLYNHMAAALGVTGLIAFIIANSPQMLNLIFNTPLQWVVMFAPLAMIFFVMPNLINYSIQKARTMFFVFAALMGVSLSSIFVVYTDASIVQAFFVTASIFGGMSLYGYTTKRDLTSMGSFFIMGLIGIIIASLINIFLQSSMLNFVVSIISVFIFTGLTAYDTQKIKNIYYQVSGNGELAAKVAIYGALNLYMDFINIMISVLRIMGDRR